MPISHAELITLTCPACGTSHTADIWLIVAPDERPDLLEQIRNGALHTVTCPQCGQTHTLDAPLLIFRPTAAPPILFSPAQQTTSEQDQQHAAALIGILRQRLGAAWNDAWLAQGPAVVPRPMLLVALTDDPAAALQGLAVRMQRPPSRGLRILHFLAAALQGLAARMQQALAELRQRDPEAFAMLEAAARQAMAALQAADRSPDEAPASAATADAPALIQALDAFLNARTWTDSYREVQAHPELLSDEALALLEQRIATARTVGNSRAVAFFEEHLSLLRRCREVGAAAAFAEKIGVRVEELERRKAKGAVPAVFASWLATAQQAERRFLQTDDRNALATAVEAWRQILEHPAFQTAPLEFRCAVLNYAGGTFLRCYWAQGRAADLERALTFWTEALAATPPDSPDRPGYLNNLGNGLRARYARSGRLEELDDAIAAYEQALAATPPDSPDRPSRLTNLGTGLRDRYARSGRLDDLKQARRSYALACKKGQLLAPDIALTASQSWGRWAGERHHWKEAAYAFGFGLETIEQLHRAQLRRSEQELWLSAARGLHTSAAYALVRAARPGALRRAVEVAELGRARGLGETLTRDRSDLSVIERDYPDIYERYRTAAEIVRSLERTDRASADRQDTAQLSFTDLANRIRAARADLDAAIEAIRAIPGYEAFLRPPAYPEIVAAAQPGVPLVYLITTPQGSLALIVPDGNAEPEALLLDEFTENDLNNLLLVRTGDKVVGGYLPGQLLGGEALTTALETALPLLGEHLIAPVAQRLRTLNATGVTLIPTGLLSLLPLHAATYTVNGASRCLLDEFDVAYAPSARVLSIAQREQQRRAAKGVRLAGVGNPLPSDATGDWALAELRRGLPNLRQQVQKVLPALEAAALARLEELTQQTPAQVIRAGSDLARAAALFAALPADAGAFLSAIAARIPPSLTYARSELISILDLLPANAGAPLYEQQATREALWAVLSEATMAHFACHGQFGLDDTLDSALLLAQESRLTLRDLVAGDTTALSNLRLVALSACQTAITDFRRLPDESIGLPGGFLQTGVPAVIGTLWSINDLISTALLIYRFYELHLRGDAAAGLTPQPPVRALRLAQQWLRDLTYKEMFAYFQWHRQLKGARMSNDLIEEGRALAEDYMLDHPNDRPYANPIFWAAFTFNGTIGGAA